MDSAPVEYTLGNDLCSSYTETLAGYTTTVSFNTATGQHVFNSDDRDNYPLGQYVFTITITIGDKTESVTYTMNLIFPCGNALLQVGSNPFANGPFTYVLTTSPETAITYNQNFLVSSSTTANCGDL